MDPEEKKFGRGNLSLIIGISLSLSPFISWQLLLDDVGTATAKFIGILDCSFIYKGKIIICPGLDAFAGIELLLIFWVYEWGFSASFIGA